MNPGSWGSVRDHSPAAQRLFDAPVPAELLTSSHKQAGEDANWSTAFGTNADEYFQAWSVAHFIGQVAAAGKAEYPLPLYTNAALRDPLTPGPAGSYESGGPTDNVIPIWKAAAPSLDLVAPGYLPERPCPLPQGLGVVPPLRQCSLRAGNRQLSGKCAFLLRRAGPSGDRFRAVRHRLHGLFERAVGRAAAQ